jgi:hypothetical protein
MNAPWILGQFETPEAMLDAARQLRERGHADIDGYAPFPVHGMEEAFALPSSKVPYLVLCGGLSGASLGYFMQYWCNAVDFQINVGGRPFHAFWSNIPITFECGILLGGFAAFFGLFALLRLPRLHHPVFDAEPFRSASQDRFWISIRAVEREKAEADLKALGATEISIVEDVP